MIEVQEINRIEQLSEPAHRSAWWLLLDQTANASFFHTLEWLETYWQHFGHAQQLRVLVIRHQNEILGYIPWVQRTEPTKLGDCPIIDYPLDNWGTFYGPIGPNPELLLAHGLQHLLQTTPRRWKTIDLRSLEYEHMLPATCAALQQAGVKPYPGPWSTSSIVDLAAGWDPYWNSRKTHWRTNVRSAEKKLARRGAIEYIRYRPVPLSNSQLDTDANTSSDSGITLGLPATENDPRWDLYNACEQLAGCSWQGASESGTTLSHTRVRAFLRDAHVAATRLGMLDLNLLMLCGRPAAFNYNYISRGHIFGLRMGYDREIAHEGSGTVLLHRMLQDSCSRGDRSIDLGPGYLRCKRNWQTHTVTTGRCVYYPALSLQAQALKLKRRLTSWLRPGHLPGMPAGS